MKILTAAHSILIILEDQDMERIKQQDPAELRLDQLPRELQRPLAIGVVYLPPADVVRVVALMREHKPREAFKFATRGFTVKPDDHDMGPTSLLDDKADA